jgi:hypothetical protein
VPSSSCYKVRSAPIGMEQPRLRPYGSTYDILEAFFVTAAKTPPPPLSFACPFFLLFLVDVEAPVPAPFLSDLRGGEVPVGILLS